MEYSTTVPGFGTIVFRPTQSDHIYVECREFTVRGKTQNVSAHYYLWSDNSWHLGMEKYMPVLDCNGSYLNNDRSKVINEQILSFQSFLNNYNNNIIVAKQMPIIRIFDKTINEAQKITDILTRFYGSQNGRIMANTWADKLSNNSEFGYGYIDEQLKISRLNTSSLNDKYKLYLMNRNTNEIIISLVLSEATRKNILFSFPKLYDFYYTKKYLCNVKKIIPSFESIINNNNLDINISTLISKHYMKTKLLPTNINFNNDFIPINFITI
jgi:hypothetical protein